VKPPSKRAPRDRRFTRDKKKKRGNKTTNKKKENETRLIYTCSFEKLHLKGFAPALHGSSILRRYEALICVASALPTSNIRRGMKSEN